MSIAKQIVLRLGGDVSFADAPDGGTVFLVELPRLDAETAAPLIREYSNNAASNRPHLLICDDDAAVAKTFSLRLAVDGFSSDIAPTGRDALARTAETSYAAILVDLKLPDCDGISLIQQLRAQPQTRDTPIIVVSGDLSRGREDIRALGLDVLDWFQKPVNINRLAQMLDRISARDPAERPRVLHIDEDPAVLEIVAAALATLADVVSVDSVDAARQALVSNRFDLAVLDIAPTSRTGLDMLPILYDSEGGAIPVIVFSPQGANPACAERAHASLSDSTASLDSLVATLRKRLRPQSSLRTEH